MFVSRENLNVTSRALALRDNIDVRLNAVLEEKKNYETRLKNMEHKTTKLNGFIGFVHHK